MTWGVKRSIEQYKEHGRINNMLLTDCCWCTQLNQYLYSLQTVFSHIGQLIPLRHSVNEVTLLVLVLDKRLQIMNGWMDVLKTAHQQANKQDRLPASRDLGPWDHGWHWTSINKYIFTVSGPLKSAFKGSWISSYCLFGKNCNCTSVSGKQLYKIQCRCKVISV